MLALLSDVHANLEALESVLRELEREKVKDILFLGDAVGYGANPNETISLLRGSRMALLGNHDAAVLDLENLENFNEHARASLLWTREMLEEQSSHWLKGLPFVSALQEEIRLVHASPKEPRAWRYLLSLHQIAGEFRAFNERICFFGHTHVQAAYLMDANKIVELEGPQIEMERGSRYMINPGSVGQPRDRDPRAAYGILDLDSWTFFFRRVRYDIEKSQKKIEEAGLPPFLAERLSFGI